MADDAKREKIKVRIFTATHHRIDGEVVILEGYRGRLSDVLNDGRIFLPISNAEVYDEKGDLVSQSPFVSINKSAASLIIPLD
jgi:hypothetical protein